MRQIPEMKKSCQIRGMHAKYGQCILVPLFVSLRFLASWDLLFILGLRSSAAASRSSGSTPLRSATPPLRDAAAPLLGGISGQLRFAPRPPIPPNRTMHTKLQNAKKLRSPNVGTHYTSEETFFVLNQFETIYPVLNQFETIYED